MLSNISVVLLAVAVSLDSFGVGMNYGLRKISIPTASIVIIAVCSGFMIIVSMLFGTLLLPIVPEEYAAWIGGMILIMIGIWAVLQIWRQRRTEEDVAEDAGIRADRQVPRRLVHLELKRLGIVIEILRKPSKADMDRSGTISAGEAALLGTALSLDAFGAGIGAAFIGLSPWVTSLFITLFCALFLKLGISAGKLFADIAWVKKLSFLPGIILIVLGISRILQ